MPVQVTRLSYWLFLVGLYATFCSAHFLFLLPLFQKKNKNKNNNIHSHILQSNGRQTFLMLKTFSMKIMAYFRIVSYTNAMEFWVKMDKKHFFVRQCFFLMRIFYTRIAKVFGFCLDWKYIVLKSLCVNMKCERTTFTACFMFIQLKKILYAWLFFLYTWVYPSWISLREYFASHINLTVFMATVSINL